MDQDELFPRRQLMKTTLNLNDQLLRQAKASAHTHGVTLTRFVEEALRARLMSGDSPESKYKFDPPVVNGAKLPVMDVSDRKLPHGLPDEV